MIASFNAACSKHLLNVQQKASMSALFSTTLTFGLAPLSLPLLWWKTSQSLHPRRAEFLLDFFLLEMWRRRRRCASVFFACSTPRIEQLSLCRGKAHTQDGQEMTALPAASTHLRSILTQPLWPCRRGEPPWQFTVMCPSSPLSLSCQSSTIFLPLLSYL